MTAGGGTGREASVSLASRRGDDTQEHRRAQPGRTTIKLSTLRTPRQHLTIPTGTIRLKTGQVLRSGGQHPHRPGVHAWTSGDGLTVTAHIVRGALFVGLHRDGGLPSGHEINAVTKALYPDTATVHMLMNEPDGWVSKVAAVDPPAGMPMPAARSA